MPPSEVDYLVIGAGARGMAFADHILHGDPSATVALVDRRPTPGGHWNDAYPFVRLHQPALYYGVTSTPLGSGGRDLASKSVLLDYYADVQRRMEATGRCHFLLGHAYEGEGVCRSVTDPAQAVVLRARKRLVDSVYVQVEVPAMRPPAFRVDPSCTILPLNALAEPAARSWSRYVVIGAGKTGMDAVLELLHQGTDPDRITWVVSRDPWLIVRDHIWPDLLLSSLPGQSRVIANLQGTADLFHGFEKLGIYARIWPEREPTSFRCATVSLEEIAQLRRIQRVVRLGRVQRIDATRIQLQHGELPTGPDVLHVDCTAQGLPLWPVRPLFEPGRITLQSVLFCQPTASAALVAAVELALPDDDARNLALRAVLPPDSPEATVATLEAFYDNARACLRYAPLRRFIAQNRLSMIAHMSRWRMAGYLLLSLPWFFRVEARIRQLAATLPARPRLAAREPLRGAPPPDGA